MTTESYRIAGAGGWDSDRHWHCASDRDTAGAAVTPMVVAHHHGGRIQSPSCLPPTSCSLAHILGRRAHRQILGQRVFIEAGLTASAAACLPVPLGPGKVSGGEGARGRLRGRRSSRRPIGQGLGLRPNLERNV